MTTLDYADIQGNVLLGYRYPHVSHLFGWIDDGNLAAWRDFLRALEPFVTRSDWGPSKPSTTLNLGFSYQGLAKLQPAIARELASFTAFVQGMPKRSAELGDDDAFARKRWEDRHVWLSVHAQDPTTLAARVAELRQMADRLDLATERPGTALLDANQNWCEHFGFRDDISYPAVEGTPHLDDDDVPGRGKLEQGSWLRIRSGEFLLGYQDESDGNPGVEVGESAKNLLKNGTFGVVRQLRQNVAAFRKYLDEQSRPQADASYLAARMMGRETDGRPLVAVDSRAKPTQLLSDFTYEDDKLGARCPLGAHVRRANPRSGGRHRLIRRGMSYGPAFVPSEVGEVDRGLWFVAFNASIEDQFEFIQKQWLNTPVGTLSEARDPVAAAGRADGAMVIEGDHNVSRAPRLLLDIPSFVTCLGGQYYLYPGLAALHVISGEPAPASAAKLGGIS